MTPDPRYAPFLPDVEKAADALKGASWFDEGWRVTAGPFQDGAGVFVGMGKSRRFLRRRFEGSLEWGGFNLGHVVCAMHVLHRGAFSRTQKGREAFSLPFVQSPEVRRFIRSWKAGYRVNPHGGMVPLRRNAPRTPDNLAEVLVTEFTRFAQLGPEIDRILREEVGI
jgi:hypothetical protein